jgi:hypothetical protein
VWLGATGTPSNVGPWITYMYINVHVTSLTRSPERNNKMALARILYLAWGLMAETKEAIGVVQWGYQSGIAEGQVFWDMELCCCVSDPRPFDRYYLLPLDSSIKRWRWRQCDPSKCRKQIKIQESSYSHKVVTI